MAAKISFSSSLYCRVFMVKKFYLPFFLVANAMAGFCLPGQQTTPSTGGVEPAIVYFSPKDHVADKLISLIQQEKKAIKAAVYCLTHRGVINALIDARKRGVEVELIVDPFTIKARAPTKRLTQAGVVIFVWDPPPKQMGESGKVRVPLMHNKFAIFEGQEIVWTGSFNFTSEAANSNQENVVVLHQTDHARAFLEQFEGIKGQGCRLMRDYLATLKTKKKT